MTGLQRFGKAALARLVRALITLSIVAVLVFVLIRLIPGNPVETILGTDATPEAERALRAELHLDMPLGQQMVLYVQGLLQGDLGMSAIQRGLPATAIIRAALPVTLALAGCGMCLGAVTGIGFGLWAALSKRRGVDLAIRSTAMLLYATPTFLTALVLILVFSIRLAILPAGGWPGTYPANLVYLILPATALAGHLAPSVARTVRQAAIDTARQSFIEASLARGLPQWRINVFHLLPNALLPVIALLAVNVGTLLTGAIIVEAVFGMVGLGTELTRAVMSRDYPVVEGIALTAAASVILGNLLGEWVNMLVDPRAGRAS